MQDEMAAAVRRIYDAAFEPEKWEPALQRIAELFGSSVCIFELADNKGRIKEIRSVGMPPIADIEYAAEFAAKSPRLPYGLRQKQGEIAYDSLIVAPEQMARDPFYAEFLPKSGLRYFLSGIVHRTDEEMAAVSIQYKPSHGHVQTPQIERMRAMLPLLEHAFGIVVKARTLSIREQTFVQALEALDEAVLVVRGDAHLVYANALAERLIRAGQVITLSHGEVAFRDRAANIHFRRALNEATSLAEGRLPEPAASEFLIAGPVSPLVASMRPLLGEVVADQLRGHANAILFVKPARPRGGNGDRLREAFGLTNAETALALALLGGEAVPDYASRRAISMNTAYTHLRRLREKTGTHRLTELIHKLDSLG